jgi:hypothetical protein
MPLGALAVGNAPGSTNGDGGWRKKLSPLKILLGAIGLAIGVVLVLLLREATLSTHETVEGQGTEVELFAETKGGETGQSLDEMVEAQLLNCRLEVSSDIDGAGIESLGEGRYRAVLMPVLDETNQRQFRGCLEDWLIDHVRIDVLELDELDGPDGSDALDEPDGAGEDPDQDDDAGEDD